MNNSYFRKALVGAQSILVSRSRLLSLVFQLSGKLTAETISREYWKERLFSMGRLLGAFATGRYRQIPLRSILLVIAAIIYFVNPLDLIPDAIIGFGFTDDLAVLTGVYNLVNKELDKFRKWETGISYPEV